MTGVAEFPQDVTDHVGINDCHNFGISRCSPVLPFTFAVIVCTTGTCGDSLSWAAGVEISLLIRTFTFRKVVSGWSFQCPFPCSFECCVLVLLIIKVQSVCLSRKND